MDFFEDMSCCGHNGMEVKWSDTCNICGKKLVGTDRVVDYIVPLSEGGTTNVDNQFYVCRDCKYKRQSKEMAIKR
ncbi:HNH endonuclease [Lachnospira multipara]|jgi:5-methylcytosine-specific restriction endonuclease McrA|uniref:HNH endonuclease n=1 Tax=Lachnospira multipara TaxID=28051 RepID=UPI000486DE9C|nr:HNH endonuclease signature motif containing protein [Lachnospira multipara]